MTERREGRARAAAPGTRRRGGPAARRVLHHRVARAAHALDGAAATAAELPGAHEHHGPPARAQGRASRAQRHAAEQPDRVAARRHAARRAKFALQREPLEADELLSQLVDELQPPPGGPVAPLSARGRPARRALGPRTHRAGADQSDRQRHQVRPRPADTRAPYAARASTRSIEVKDEDRASPSPTWRASSVASSARSRCGITAGSVSVSTWRARSSSAHGARSRRATSPKEERVSVSSSRVIRSQNRLCCPSSRARDWLVGDARADVRCWAHVVGPHALQRGPSSRAHTSA